MVDTIALVHALTRLEVLLRAVLTPQQHHLCAALLPSLQTAVGILQRPSATLPGLGAAADEGLRQRYRLSRREVEVLRLLLLGKSNVGVADALRVSAHTARHHTERILMKVHVHSRAQLAAAIGGFLG